MIGHNLKHIGKYGVSFRYPIEKIEIYNQSGICALINNNPTEELNISGLADGIYFVRIYADGAVLMKKIILK